ncbi:hypothetical protein CANCADRAFT_94786 [Tortispora caseinolytica NRRL Y-17796]|uniref:NADH-ubiquinone oxidoreductase 9.5 kDa subunit n=1 Tax=Tortispora caseinolytica NRRL Y-17796 TaxID=767744 RepID=A0A1E4TMA6_9ASCO|nr:hypothetical protein CANCADRAFT_94786 [Tortispora caseinolytica NRRL Y-17796]
MKPELFKQPFKYMRWCAHHYPAYFFSLLLGFSFPVAALAVTPLRRKFLYDDHIPIPRTYPLPRRAREPLTGFGDDDKEFAKYLKN